MEGDQVEFQVRCVRVNPAWPLTRGELQGPGRLSGGMLETLGGSWNGV